MIRQQNTAKTNNENIIVNEMINMVNSIFNINGNDQSQLIDMKINCIDWQIKMLSKQSNNH